VVRLLKRVEPGIVLVVGGPEVSFAGDLPPLAEAVDFVITGPGEKSFPRLCRDLLAGRPVLNRVIAGEPLPLDEIVLPYAYYGDEDIRNRLVYVEASRGCPFKCEFCLSALDKTAKPFPLDAFLEEMALLHERGARHFKFIDRTFNLKVSSNIAILEFFLERMSDDLYLHFELIPDQLPEKLRRVLLRFPAGSLQFEIGVQTFDARIQAFISRRQDNEKSRDNLRWLRENTGAHIHADLIFGLPGDSLENFADSFNQLVALAPQEIQLGILKRLRGAPIDRHTGAFDMRYNPAAPYNVLATRDIDFATMQRMTRFARFWDLVANSGRFRETLPLLLGDDAFARFLCFSDGLYELAGRSWKISLSRLFGLSYRVLTEQLGCAVDDARDCLGRDFEKAGLRGRPPFDGRGTDNGPRGHVANRRQRQHA